MTRPTTTQPAAAIPAQPGPRDVTGAATATPGGDMAATGSTDGATVIPGAGPAGPAGPRPGERATVRLRDTGEEEPPRYAPEWLQLRERDFVLFRERMLCREQNAAHTRIEKRM